MKNPTSKSESRNSQSGFTLVEVLVSSALTLLVMAMLFTVLFGAMNAWQAGTGRLQGNADARMALDIIASDLQSVVARQTTYNQEWLVSDLLATPNDPTGRRATQLLFFAPSLDRAPGQQGDIVAINYRIGFFDPLAPTSPRLDTRIFGLYKTMPGNVTMTATEETFASALGQADIRAGFWNTRTPPDQNPPAQDLLIPNVVDFSVKWNVNYNGVIGPADILLNFNNEPNFFIETVKLSNDFIAKPSTSSQFLLYSGVKLDSADISLTILTDEGAGRVQAFAQAGNLAARLPDIIREFGRVYTKRVQIQY